MTAPILVPTRDAILCAVECLRAGQLVAFPTETVYGLGADARNPAAVRRIFAAKRRPADHPVIVHLHEIAQLSDWASHVPPAASALAAAFWPGPLTLILARHTGVSDAVTGGQDRVGLRIPRHPVARELLEAFSGGIAAPSANRFGRISPTTARHVADDLDNAVSMILDGGACDVGIESTIVAFDGDEPMLLRPGGIGGHELRRVLGRAPRLSNADAPRASGTLASHYAPRTPAMLVTADALQAEVAQFTDRDEDIAVLSLSVRKPVDFATVWINASTDPLAYAHDLYANLRALDAANADVILIESVPDSDEWSAIGDRLSRATRGEDDDRD